MASRKKDQKPSPSRETQIRPLGDRVLIKKNPAPKTTQGGILLPETVRETPTQGKVLAHGPGRLRNDGSRRPIDVQIGDEVYFRELTGVEIEHQGESLLFLSEDEILAVIV